MVEHRICEGITKAGKPCRADALPGSPFCGHHGMKPDGTPIVRATATNSKWARYHAAGLLPLNKDEDELR